MSTLALTVQHFTWCKGTMRSSCFAPLKSQHLCTMIIKTRLLHSLTLLSLTTISSWCLAAMVQLLNKTDSNCSSCRNPGLDPARLFPKKHEIFSLFQGLSDTTDSLTAPWLWKVQVDTKNKKGCWIVLIMHCQLQTSRTGKPLPYTQLWISLELLKVFPN